METDREQLDADIAQQYNEILASHRHVYEQSADPFAAWGAFLVCRRFGWGIPRWVMGYFDGAAKGLHEVYRAQRRNLPARLAEALGFKQRGPGGRGGRPRKLLAERDAELVLEVLQARQTEGSLKAAKIVAPGACKKGAVVRARPACSYDVGRPSTRYE
jgi:hypothetical protein